MGYNLALSSTKILASKTEEEILLGMKELFINASLFVRQWQTRAMVWSK